MKLLVRVLLAIALLLVPYSTSAQSPGQVTAQPGNLAGLLFASSFGQWQVPQGNAGQFSWSSANFCKANADGFYLNPVFAVGTPVTIVDAVAANTETVVPSAVTVTGSGCSITVNPTHPHLSFYLTSGTGGLQEAINFARNLPYQVVVTSDWSRLGGQTGMLSAAINGTNVGVVDWRTNCPVPYSWSGSAYVAGTSWCSGGGGSGCTVTGTTNYFVFWNGTACVTKTIDEGVTQADTTTTIDQNVSLIANGDPFAEVFIEADVNSSSFVNIVSSGEDGIWLSTHQGQADGPVNGSGNIVLDSGVAITEDAVAHFTMTSGGGWEEDDNSDSGVGAQINTNNTAAIEINAAGAASLNGNGVSLADSGSVGVSIDSSSGPVAIAGNVINEYASNGINLYAGTDFSLFSSATPSSGHTYCLQISSTGLVSNTGAACGSGSGAVNSVVNSDGTLTISPTTGSVVASLALGHANTWTAKQTQPAPLFSDLTGSTQCLHVNSSGQVSGTGSDCGAGGGGVSSFSAGALSPLFTTSVATATTTPALTFSLSSAAQNSVFAGPASGGAGTPSYQTAPTISAANMTSFPTLNQSTTGNAATATALAGTPTLCSSGNAPTGILANGNATGCAAIGGGSTVWSALTSATGNLSLSNAAYSTTFNQVSTGSGDLFKWADTGTGTGILGHFTVALGSSEIPWQADVNGLGWKVGIDGSLTAVGSSPSHGLTIPGGLALSGLANALVITTNSSGLAFFNENNTGASRVCTAANGQCPGGTTSPGGTNGQVEFNNAGVFGGFTVGGDGTLNTATGALTVTKSSGTAFGTAAFDNTGTSGPVIPLLNASNAFSALDQFSAGLLLTGGGSASNSPVYDTGALFTGGSATTTWPHWYINHNTGVNPTWVAGSAGTDFGMNETASFQSSGGEFLQFNANGVSVFDIDGYGDMTSDNLNARAYVAGPSVRATGGANVHIMRCPNSPFQVYWGSTPPSGCGTPVDTGFIAQ